MEGKVTAISMRHMRFPVSDVKCYEIITTSIGRNYTLKVLSWVHNRIPSDEQAGLLIKSAIHNQSIHTLHLDNCFDQTGVNGCRALTTLMTCGRPFDALSFRRNGLSGIDDVAAAMATNPQLKELDWIDNELNDRDAELIAQALKQNTNLQELYLHRNGITSAGFERIGTTIYDPSSLNAMESCNYTCWVDDVAGNEHGKSPLQNRNRKIVRTVVNTTRGRQQRALFKCRVGGGATHPQARAKIVCLGKRCLSRLDSSCTLQTGGMLPGRQTAAPRVASSAPWVGKPSRRGRGSGARRHRRLCYEGGMALEREGGYTRALPPIDVHSRSPLAPTPGDSGPSAIPRRGGATAGTSHPEGGRDDDDAPARPPNRPRGLARDVKKRHMAPRQAAWELRFRGDAGPMADRPSETSARTTTRRPPRG
ncbi:hypothetical protein THAOC_14311, partial [Thalassiosira oceanica]